MAIGHWRHFPNKLWKLNQHIMLSEAQYNLIEPLVYTSRIFGLCPIRLTKTGQFYQMKYSPFLIIYSYLFVVVFGTIIGVNMDIEAGVDAIRMKRGRSKYIIICDMAIVFLIALYGTLSIPFRMKRFIKLLNIWSEIDTFIPICNYQKYKKASIIFLATTLTGFTILFLLDILFYTFSWKVSNNPFLYLKHYTSFFMLYYVLIFQEIFYWHSVFFIHIRIAMLNKSLIMEKQYIEMMFQKLFVLPYTTNKGSDNKGLHRMTQCETIRFSKSAADRMIDLLKVYGKIRESVETLNESASYGVLLIILSCLLHLVETPYFVLLEILREKNCLFLILQLFWLIAHVGRLLILVEPCQKCLDEYKITSSLISEMALLEFDKETKKLLKHFASQFFYAEISFNACGFFTVDRNLLTSICGAISTYLVILFQFNGNE